MDKAKLELMKKIAEQTQPLLKERHKVWVNGKVVEVYISKGGK